MFEHDPSGKPLHTFPDHALEGPPDLSRHALDGVGVSALIELLVGKIKTHNNDYRYH
ncbi:hypothetical protein [Bradyrhizobium jicamae]|uniref:hypothetical protein n=1 Tax=Bradyrhizobium jicamae TaxID=280332 RepID=UPI001BAB917B|nr:hypothetical protein [Bradyrhizobium jicamae]MBR0937060.1 hypothetical protein [Bradyrhizobium jicamae]